jgi:hypothetical protein
LLNHEFYIIFLVCNMSCTCDCHNSPHSALVEDVSFRVGLLEKVWATRYPDVSDWTFSEPLFLLYAGVGMIIHAVGICLHVVIRKVDSIYAKASIPRPLCKYALTFDGIALLRNLYQ